MVQHSDGVYDKNRGGTLQVNGDIMKDGFLFNTSYQIALDGSSNNKYVHIGTFKIYDTNITINISSTTRDSSSATWILAFQNSDIKSNLIYGAYSNSQLINNNLFCRITNKGDNTNALADLYIHGLPYQKLIFHIEISPLYNRIANFKPSFDLLSAFPTDGDGSYPSIKGPMFVEDTGDNSGGKIYLGYRGASLQKVDYLAGYGMINGKLYIKDIRVRNAVYPVGSIYMSSSSTSPASLFGGTWERLKGGYLYGAVNSWGTGNGTGTSTNNHVLSIDQMPKHYHTYEDSYHFFAQGDATGGGIVGEVSQTTKNFHYNTSEVGGTSGHSHKIPYIAVFTWRRTA